MKNCEIDDDTPTCTLSVDLSREERVREYRAHGDLIRYFINGPKGTRVLSLNYNASMTYHSNHDESGVFSRST